MSTFLEELLQAEKNTYAVGAFNILNHLSASAVIQAATEINCPVILQTSVTTVRKFGHERLGGMLRELAEKASVPVLIHLDHCKDVDLAMACIDAGWDSVMYDGSWLPIEENIEKCRKVVSYAHEKGVQVEGELGTIAGVEDDIHVEAGAEVGVNFEEAIRFVHESGIDVFAPAIGTAHGVYKGVPKINFDLVKQLYENVETPLVIHGGTGLSEEAFTRLIRNGASKVNVSTAIKYAYINGYKEYFSNYPEKLDPLGLDSFVESKIKEVAMTHLRIFRQTMQSREK